MEMKKLVRLSMLLSLSVALNIFESFIPILGNIIPGSKLGLANIVTLFVIYLYGFKDAIFVSLMRVLLVGIIRTGLFNITFFFSLGGAILSVIAMYLSYKFTKLSVVGISIIGSIFHSIGQILIAILILKMPQMVYYLPYLLLLSIPTGIIIGMISKRVISFYKKVDDISF
jgi:heptaprenyl diphosphate synthase